MNASGAQGSPTGEYSAGLEGAQAQPHDLQVLRIGVAKAPAARAHLPFDQGRLFRFHPRRGVLYRPVPIRLLI
jgi:hypothetical protein